MFYLGIDQHRKQLTVNLRNEAGDVVLRRQVSTEWSKVRKFFTELAERTALDGYAAILEVCGFNDWLLVFDVPLGRGTSRDDKLIEAAWACEDGRMKNNPCRTTWSERPPQRGRIHEGMC